MTTNISYLAGRLRELHSKLRNTFEFMDGALAAEAADALQQQAERITAQDVKCRLYEAALDKADAEIEGFRCALSMLYAEQVDYITLNHLGDPHHNQSMKLARAALSQSTEAK
jgi:hypothetical protein